MHAYVDADQLDTRSAAETLPALPEMQTQTGTSRRIKSGTTRGSSMGPEPTATGTNEALSLSDVTTATGTHWHQKSPSGKDGLRERVKGVEPSTSSLETHHIRKHFHSVVTGDSSLFALV
jgi:hypothetical protein